MAVVGLVPAARVNLSVILATLLTLACNCSHTGLSGKLDAVDTATPEDVLDTMQDPSPDLSPDPHTDSGMDVDTDVGGDPASDTEDDRVEPPCTEGEVLVSLSDLLPLSEPGSNSPDSRLLWTGSEYLALWSTDRNTLFGSRFPPPTMVTPDPTVILEAEFTELPVAVWLEGYLALGWSEDRPSGEDAVMYALTDPLVGSPAIVTELLTTSGAWTLQMNWCGSSFLYALEVSDASGSILVANLDGAGLRICEDTVVVEGDSVVRSRAMDCDGTTGAIVWPPSDHFTETLFYFTTLEVGETGHGEVIDLSSPDRLHLDQVDMTWTGEDFAVVWTVDEHEDTISFMRISPTGETVIPPVALPALDVDGFVGIQKTGDVLTVGWTGSGSGYRYGYVRSIAMDGTVLGDHLRLPTSEWYTTIHDMVWTGTELGVLVMDGRGSLWGLFFTRVGLCET